MILEKIDILNFKNIREANLDFYPGVNCLLGMNGMGKSNLLDAIHFLCMARPMTALPETSLLTHGEGLMLVKGEFVTDAGSQDIISCGIEKGKRKSLKRNGKEYTRFSEHIGRYPIVIATPDDSAIITGGGEGRRKLMDMVISQSNPEYLAALIKYGRCLESRNKMLRAGVDDILLYESIEAGMEDAASVIYRMRQDWVNGISPIVEDIYARISGGRESIRLEYRSQLHETTLSKLLDERRKKDHILGFSSAGIHRDDVDNTLNGYSIRSLGSQGQIKTFAVSLRLGIFTYLKKRKGMTPLLLLDDIFDKLDAQRVENIMKEVTASDRFGQIFITDTNRKHLDDILSGIQGPRTLINVSDGCFNPLTFTD